MGSWEVAVREAEEVLVLLSLEDSNACYAAEDGLRENPAVTNSYDIRRTRMYWKPEGRQSSFSANEMLLPGLLRGVVLDH